MHLLEVGLVILAPALLVWDVAHANMDDVRPYLTLWLVCLSVAALLHG